MRGQGYNSIMSDTPAKAETRGRPRKNTEQRLPPISRKLFSEHCAVFYACCMVYVLEVFLKTKTEKRIGHSEGGFTLYEKINPAYCFDSLDDDLRDWGCAHILATHPALADFLKTVNGCAPRFVFRELVALVVGLAEAMLAEGVVAVEELDLAQVGFLNSAETELNRRFKYLRFSPAALRQLKMDKWAGEVSRKIRDLWQPFLKIVAYTVLGKSKYLKPFFSDAEHPEDTIIGQLNLEQIVQQREREERGEKEEKEQKEERPSPPSLGFTKIIKLEGGKQEERRLQFKTSSPPFADRPLLNLRPITLITFPSNTQIDTSSPFKQKASVGVGVEEKDIKGMKEAREAEGEKVEQQDPSKKLKTD